MFSYAVALKCLELNFTIIYQIISTVKMTIKNTKNFTRYQIEKFIEVEIPKLEYQ